MEEIWKVVPFDPRYEASNCGRIRHIKTKRIRKLHHDHRGYMTFGVYKRTGNSCWQVHQAVAEAFMGSRPEGKVTDHIDGDRTNNNLSNLQYITHRENSARGLVGDLRKGRSSNYRGVRKRVKKTKTVWEAQASLQGKSTYIGTFNTELEAANAYEEVIKNTVA